MQKSLDDPAIVAALASRFGPLAPESRALWGVMSAGQMLWHLDGAFRLAMGELPVARMGFHLRNPVARFLVLRSGVPWPHGTKTVPELERRRDDAPGNADFAATKSEVARLVRAFVEHETLLAEHPMLGRMTRAQWMRWGYLHTDHHLRQFGC